MKLFIPFIISFLLPFIGKAQLEGFITDQKEMKGYGLILGTYKSAITQQTWSKLNGVWNTFESSSTPMIKVVVKQWDAQ